MKFFFYSAVALQISCFGALRNIFNYDLDWKHTDYDIVAQGVLHETGKAFKVLQCGGESKIVIEK